MNRFFLALFAISFSTLFGVFFTGYSASAASVYDGEIVTTSSLTLTSPDGLIVQDVTDSYMSYIVNEETQLGCTPERLDIITQAEHSYVKQQNLYDGTLGTRVVGVYGSTGDHGVSFSIHESNPLISFDPHYPRPETLVTWTISNEGDITAYCRNYSNLSYVVALGLNTFLPGGLNYIYYYNYTINYPTEYEGEIIPDSTTPPVSETLTPEYSWEVKEGKLKLTYMKNLSHFLTGSNFIVVDKMTNNWESIDTPDIIDETYQPAGWLDEEYQLDGAGYYQVRIDHNQQLDSPPWPENNNYDIQQVWFRIKWNGTETLSGTTVGCTASICNDFIDDESPALRALNYLGVPIYGFQQVVLAPMDLITQLPTASANCMPLVLPLPYLDSDITLPCMKPVYDTHFSSIITIYQTILVGIFSYYAGIRVFENIKGLSNPKDDRIETVKL